MLSNSARSSQKSASTPRPLVISSTSGPASGAPMRSAACGPRYALRNGCSDSHRLTVPRMVVFRGRARPVPMSTPHRMATAKSGGDSRSRRSRNQSTDTGMSEASAARPRPLTNTLADPGLSAWTAKNNVRTETAMAASSPAATDPATRGPRRGEPSSSRSDSGRSVPGIRRRPSWTSRASAAAYRGKILDPPRGPGRGRARAAVARVDHTARGGLDASPTPL